MRCWLEERRGNIGEQTLVVTSCPVTSPSRWGCCLGGHLRDGSTGLSGWCPGFQLPWRSLLMAVLGLMTGEQTEEGCCCVTTARPPSPVASAQYGRTWPHVTRSGAWLRPETLGPRDSQLETFSWLCPFPAGATGHSGPRRLVSFHLDQVLQWPPCPPLCFWCNF